MSSISVPAAAAYLTSTGGADGTVTVASTAAFFAGCEAWLSDDLGNSQKVRISKILDTTSMVVVPIQEVNNVNYLSGAQAGDVSGFELAKASLSLAGTGAGNITTVIEALTEGAAGNDITIALVDTGLGGGATYSELGSAITLGAEDGVTTWDQVEDLITNQSTLIAVNPGMVGAGGYTFSANDDAFEATALVGGARSRINMPSQPARINAAYTKPGALY